MPIVATSNPIGQSDLWNNAMKHCEERSILINRFKIKKIKKIRGCMLLGSLVKVKILLSIKWSYRGGRFEVHMCLNGSVLI